MHNERSPWRRIRGAALVGLLVVTGPARADAETGRDVLVLDAGAAGRPVSLAATSALAAAFDTVGGERPHVYYEWLDQDRFPDPTLVDTVRRYIDAKYATRPPAVVVALGEPAVAFAVEARDRRWPTVPIVAVVTSAAMIPRVAAVPRTVIMPMIYDVRGTIAAALAVLPDTDTIALVAAGDAYLPQVEADLAAGFPALRLLRLVDLPLEDLQQRVATLPPRTVVLYTQYVRDPAGRPYVGRQVLADLAPRANRPVVAYAPTYFGAGITGGSIHDLRAVAGDVVRVVGALLADTPIARIERRMTQPLPHFDARQLQRWRVDEARVPAGSVVAYRTPTLWSQYRRAVLTGGAVMVLQAGLIAALLLERRRRRAADRQARGLSRRLFTAQEEERRRIARELHDGVNQELALFAMQLDQSQHEALADRARTLATDLHRLSHQLHPAMLDQLGLVPALQQFAHELGQGRAIDVELRTSQWPSQVPPALAVAFYRVAQEALQNVARHSGAGHALVHLEATAAALTMTIADHGVGFTASDAMTVHIGLAGMRERLQGIGGTLDVRSAPLQGTTILARVPHAVVASWRDEPVVSGVEASRATAPVQTRS